MVSGRTYALSICPCAWKKSQIKLVEFVAAYGDYDAGFLPRAGGVEDQPARIMAGIRVVKNAIARVENWEIEEQRREVEQKKNRHGGAGSKAANKVRK